MYSQIKHCLPEFLAPYEMECMGCLVGCALPMLSMEGDCHKDASVL